MKIITLYEHWDASQLKCIRSRQPKNIHTDTKLYTLIADFGYYLYNTEHGGICASVTVPAYLKDVWEERKY